MSGVPAGMLCPRVAGAGAGVGFSSRVRVYLRFTRKKCARCHRKAACLDRSGIRRSRLEAALVVSDKIYRLLY